ncbi:MAG TPA: HigA family addiction module antitoxin [Beijerinckiaceae bacterium]|jgi:addiction module HigA family antidote|nr:HigA family addiction module antitoxin [Beijerinckiaceae bacterium]
MMHNPAHPGEVIRESCLKPLGLTVTETATGLGVTRKTLSDLLNGHSGISPEMAIRLEKIGWSTADTWLRMQMNWDLWQARQSAGKIRVKRLRSQLQPS